jgi:endonuclease/exonuclease/phosphatase family metal-dependent hydrolase
MGMGRLERPPPGQKPAEEETMERKGLAAMAALWLAVWLSSPPALPSQQAAPAAPSPVLRLLTINVWSGLDYKGTIRFGTYETRQQREARYRSLRAQVRELDPDVIFMQEVNPAAGFAARLARDIGFSQCHQVCIGGIKLGPLGIPANCKEGNAILARKSLRLQKIEDWKLSGSFGLFGDALTIHLDQAIFAQWARILVGGRPVNLVNVHLVASPPAADPALAAAWESLRREKGMAEKEYGDALRTWGQNAERQKNELRRLAGRLRGLVPAVPLLVGGDFNIPSTSPLIVAFQGEAGLQDAFPTGLGAELFSWDDRGNRNARFSSCRSDRRGVPLQGYDLLSALYDSVPRRIDYIFCSPHFRRDDVRGSGIVLDREVEGAQPSDHFGVMAELDLANVLRDVPPQGGGVPKLGKGRIDPFPIVTYDSDIGFGYGAKLFLLNPLRAGESFDLTLFNSSKGERWYRFVFSLPDLELRQGKVYPLALDLVIDYDKYIKNNFFGFGGESSYEDREAYTREPLDVSLTLSRGFSRKLVGQLGLRYKTVRNFNFATDSRLRELPPALNAGRADYASVFSNWRFDSRDSYVNPSQGLVLQGEVEWAPRSSLGNVAFVRTSLWAQAYATLFFPKTVLALRCGAQELFGKDLPAQVLLSIGGNSSLRGSPQDRFLGPSSVLANAELRFPIFWRLGGVLGLDAGRVGESLSELSFRGWAVNPTVGLRFIMNTFVARFDVGFGKETTGIYFNFGHLF